MKRNPNNIITQLRYEVLRIILLSRILDSIIADRARLYTARRARVYTRPIALCNEIRIRSPACLCFTRCISHALFLLTVQHVDVITIP